MVNKRALYVATSNPGKLRDFAVAARAHSIDIETLPGLEEIAAPAEDEPTFAGNARSKAVYYSRFLPGEVVIADDSGLEVDALGGEPGVYSARYAERAGWSGDAEVAMDGKNDTRNNALLVERLKDVAAEARTGRYRCVLAAARDGVVLLETNGVVEGEILREPRGSGGFGYDPLFYLPAFGLTMAELDLETKHRVGHRGIAFRALLDAWDALPAT